MENLELIIILEQILQPHLPGGGGSGSGSDPDLIELLSRFNVNPKKMSVVLNQGESPGDDSGELSKTECFTVTSTGTLSVSASLSVVGRNYSLHNFN